MIKSFPHFILHFDVNKTIVCFDNVQNLNVDETLTLLFAERISASWRQGLDPMTYKKYVRKFVVPGSELDQGVKKQRLRSYQDLWDGLKIIDAQLYEHYWQEWHKAKDLLTSHHVFPSFIRLLEFLKNQAISHSIVLRTFGEDLDLVLDEIGSYYPELEFHRGKFLNGCLHVHDQILTKIEDIQQFLRYHHGAIQDDHHHWHHHHQEQASGAKPFPFERNEQVISLFFDDNLKRKQIVQVIDLNTPPHHFSQADLIHQGILLPVDTLDAIEDEKYFINHVGHFLE